MATVGNVEIPLVAKMPWGEDVEVGVISLDVKLVEQGGALALAIGAPEPLAQKWVREYDEEHS